MDGSVEKARQRISENLRDSRTRSRLTQANMEQRTGISNYDRIEQSHATTIGRLARVLEEFDAQRSLLKMADPAADQIGQNMEAASSRTRAFMASVGSGWQPGQFGDELVRAVRAARLQRALSDDKTSARKNDDRKDKNPLPPLKPVTEGILEQLGLQIEVARIRRGYSTRDLANRIARRGEKISRNTLARIESGNPRVTVEQVLQVLNALDLLDTAGSVGAFETAMANMLAGQEKPAGPQRYRAPTKNTSEFDF